MSRPLNGRCGHCGRDLPPEHFRDDLTVGTDACAKCAQGALQRAESTGVGRRYLKSYRLALDTHRRLVAGVK